MKGKFVDLFSKYWIKGHFLLGNRLYVYSEKELPNEAQHQKGRLMKFINNLGYIGGGISVEEVDKKRLKRLFNVQLLIRARSEEERKTIFSKLHNLRLSDIFGLHISDVSDLPIIM